MLRRCFDNLRLKTERRCWGTWARRWSVARRPVREEVIAVLADCCTRCDWASTVSACKRRCVVGDHGHRVERMSDTLSERKVIAVPAGRCTRCDWASTTSVCARRKEAGEPGHLDGGAYDGPSERKANAVRADCCTRCGWASTKAA